MVNKSSSLLFEAARLYYLEDLTQAAIASRLGLSRPSVSRLLKEARTQGLVTISLNEQAAPKSPLEHRLADLYRVRAKVVSVPDGASELVRLRSVAAVAARLLDSLLEPGTILGVAWGSTVTEVAQFLPKRPVAGMTVVQLNGAGNAWHTGIPYSGAILGQISAAYGARMVHFPVPAFFDYASTKEAMWKERSIKGVLAMQRQADIALFGVGAFGGSIPSHVYAGGYFEGSQLADLRAQKIVGDMCTIMLRQDGSWADLDLNRRSTGPSPSELARLGRRLCVAAGKHRAQALRAALTTGAISDLVLDQQLAELLLEDA